ncbi:MAG TPA: amidohydrolase [Bacillota bacterium]|nr:amidohydrolase [Bacillota bacterium]
MKELNDYLIKIRRHLHMFPETGFDCVNTSAFIEEELNKLKVDRIEHVGKHSLVATVCNGIGKVIGLRADFDALNITEETNLEFTSKNDGVMHACGHDAHTSMLLAACKYLVENKDKWQGTVKFIFQEAEEGPDPGGAFYIVNSGILNDVEEFFALHVSPGFDTGELAINYGNALAAADTINLEFEGVGTHAAYPHLGVDPIVMQADFIMSIQSIVSRKVDPFKTAVVTIGMVKSGTTFNIIPNKAYLSGTVRTFSNDVRDLIEKRLKVIADTVAIKHDGKCKFEYIRGYDPTVNTFDSVDKMIAAGKDIFDKITVLEEASMGAEDFSRYINLKKGAIAWLGVKNPDIENYNIHNSKFNLNEEALINGCKLFINIVMKG